MFERLHRVLLVEDDRRIGREVAAAVRSIGLDLEVAVSREAAEWALRAPVDCLILDLGLPDGDGLALCRHVRARGLEPPILILTARAEPAHRVAGLEAGADDYVTKPFHTPELLLRLRNLLRRADRSDPPSGILRSGDVWADLDSRAAGVGDRPIALKPREFDLLTFFLRHPRRAWTRAQMLDRVWGIGFGGDERTVDTHVRRLRALIEIDAGSPVRIRTVWGVGYQWAD